MFVFSLSWRILILRFNTYIGTLYHHLAFLKIIARYDHKIQSSVRSNQFSTSSVDTRKDLLDKFNCIKYHFINAVDGYVTDKPETDCAKSSVFCMFKFKARDVWGFPDPSPNRPNSDFLKPTRNLSDFKKVFQNRP